MSHYDYSGHTTNYSNITSGANSNQHNGNVYGGVTNNYNNKPAQATTSRAKSVGRRVDDYTVGWICALPVPEWQASRMLLDEEHEDVMVPENAQYQYVFGKMNGHNVVMGCLPDGIYGQTAAAGVASEMRSLFRKIRFGLLVGVGGGVWSEERDVRLGDVVVGVPDKEAGTGGVIQYDTGKAKDGEFFKTGMLNKPPETLLSVLGKHKSSTNSKFYEYMQAFGEARFANYSEYSTRPTVPDRLFESAYSHQQGATCKKCDVDQIVDRDERVNPKPRVHYGTIASGNWVIKDGKLRDLLAEQYPGILCFEMEAAGIIDRMGYLVVRGICDYCDSHKNKGWQPYAAAAAAAWAKEFLRNISPSVVLEERVPESREG